MSSENMFKSLENFLFNDNEPDYGELYSNNRMFRGVINSSLSDISVKNKKKENKKKLNEFTGPFYDIEDDFKLSLEKSLINFGVYEDLEEIKKYQKIIDSNQDKKIKRKKRVYIKYSGKMKKKRELKKKKKNEVETKKKIEIEKKQNKLDLNKKTKVNRMDIMNYLKKAKKKSVLEPKKKPKMELEPSSKKLKSTIKKKNLFNYFYKK